MRRGTPVRRKMASGAPQKNIEVKFNQVGFKKFHAANVSQYATLTILLIVIELFLVGECIIQVYLRLNKVHCVGTLWKIKHEINSDCDVAYTNTDAHLSHSTVP